jgi:hypothetical protein
MVASQVFSFDFISAYTVKKVLPRLIIAAILMQLSWFVFTLMIQFINALAIGLYTLLLGSFGASDIINILGKADIGKDGILAGITTGGLAAVILILVADPGIMFGIVLALLGALIAMLVALVTLIVRKMIIILLLVISPFAILAWILPGTNKIWSSWWQLFSKLLFMYPLITLLFAGGAIASKITMISGDQNTFNLIASVIVYFAPFFLIPSTFKFAGSTFAGINSGLGRLGQKANQANLFGVRRRAEMYKENGSRAQARRQREAERVRNYQDQFANQIQDQDANGIAGFRNRRTRARAAGGNRVVSAVTGGKFGEADDGAVARLDAGAQALITRRDQEEFATASDSLKGALNSAVPTAGQTMYDAKEAARRSILQANIGSTVGIGNRTVTVTRAMQDAAVVDAGVGKSHAQLYDYESRNPGVINQLASSNSAAFDVLDKNAPQFTRGDGSGHITGPTDPAFNTAINNFDSIGSRAQDEIVNSVQALIASGDKSQAIDVLSKISKSAVAAPDLSRISTTLGIDLAAYKSSNTSRLEVDPTSGNIVVRN